MDINNEIFQSLFYNIMPNINKKLSPLFQSARSKYGLKKNQIRVLMLIKHKENTTATFLGTVMDMKKGSLTTLIDILEEKKYVKRVIDKQDRRKHLIELTKSGENLCDEILDFVKVEFFKKISHMHKDDLEAYNVTMIKTAEFIDRL